ncbi:hypothetical protein [Desulfofundulus thermosubterraneus]|uniref:hypothetical protein n=1 Tax=Desulfofundulus thermosubterraneus TaxID=348840 RepID=UPI0009351ECB|nr:hypothetical protein [Desulfofundulus thermosubterraneus]
MSGSNTIARATAVIAVFTLLSKILGFVREMALAYVSDVSGDAWSTMILRKHLENRLFPGHER